MTIAELSAARLGLVSCTTCGLLARPDGQQRPPRCRRCGVPLESRRAGAVQRTWALLLAAAIFYVPANVLPVLTSHTPVMSESDTILGGIVYLYTSGSWPLALIVAIASVAIPLGKIAALTCVLLGLRRGTPATALERARLYRMVDFIGRWSMLDVFVDTFVVALVQLPPLMFEEVGPGVVFFMAVVVLTMLAARSFDPRLLWDDQRDVGSGR